MPVSKIPEPRPELQDATFRFLSIAVKKYAARPEDRPASAKNILTYAVYLCADEIGIEATEAHFRKALDAASRR